MTDDNGLVTITAEGAKLHASEKVSTGDYENANISLTLDVAIDGAELTEGIPRKLRARLLSMQRDLQRDVEHAVAQREFEREDENWSLHETTRADVEREKYDNW